MLEVFIACSRCCDVGAMTTFKLGLNLCIYSIRKKCNTTVSKMASQQEKSNAIKYTGKTNQRDMKVPIDFFDVKVDINITLI